MTEPTPKPQKPRTLTFGNPEYPILLDIRDLFVILASVGLAVTKDGAFGENRCVRRAETLRDLLVEKGYLP